ncbi:hypothetical protein T484DRAFT_1898253, partial [Baffinella frigidus]
MPGRLGVVLHEMQVHYVLAHLVLGPASPDTSLPRLPNHAPSQDNKDKVVTRSMAATSLPMHKRLPDALLALRLIAQSSVVTEDWLGSAKSEMMTALVRGLVQTGGKGGGGLLLIQLSKDSPALLRLVTYSLLEGLGVDAFFDSREVELLEARVRLLVLLLAAPSGTAERVHMILTAVVEFAASRDPSTDAPSSEAARPLPRLKRLAEVLVRASHVPRALAWLQENRQRWVWLQHAVQERVQPLQNRSDSSAMLINDLDEMAASTATLGVRIHGAGEPLANGAYRLMRNALSGNMQYARLVGDLDYVVARGGASERSASDRRGEHGGGGGWVLK